MAVRVKATHPNNTTATTFEWDAVEVLVAYGADVTGGSMVLSSATRTRVRTASLTSVLIGGDRYIMRWNTVNPTNTASVSNSFILAEVKA